MAAQRRGRLHCTSLPQAPSCPAAPRLPARPRPLLCSQVEPAPPPALLAAAPAQGRQAAARRAVRVRRQVRRHRPLPPGPARCGAQHRRLHRNPQTAPSCSSAMRRPLLLCIAPCPPACDFRAARSSPVCPGCACCPRRRRGAARPLLAGAGPCRAPGWHRPAVRSAACRRGHGAAGAGGQRAGEAPSPSGWAGALACGHGCSRARRPASHPRLLGPTPAGRSAAHRALRVGQRAVPAGHGGGAAATGGPLPGLQAGAAGKGGWGVGWWWWWGWGGWVGVTPQKSSVLCVCCCNTSSRAGSHACNRVQGSECSAATWGAPVACRRGRETRRSWLGSSGSVQPSVRHDLVSGNAVRRLPAAAPCHLALSGPPSAPAHAGLCCARRSWRGAGRRCTARPTRTCCAPSCKPLCPPSAVRQTTCWICR